MSKLRTHYDNLKVARNAPDSLIRAAYKVLLQQYHPDKVEDAKKQEALRITKLIRESYDVLSDPIKREEHDKWIKEQESGKYNEKPSYQKQENHDSPQAPIENNSGCLWVIAFVAFCFWAFSDDNESLPTEVKQEQFVTQPLSQSYETAQEKIVEPPLPKNDIELLSSAKELLKQKQFEEALTIYRNLVESDNQAVQADAQNELGVMYSQGFGVSQSYSIAMQWFQKSADKEYAGAEYNLGWLYEKGLSVQKDYAMAKFWYQKATEHGYSTEHSKNALISLGNDLNSLRAKFSDELSKDKYTKIWFEQSFKNGGDDYHVIFTKTQRDEGCDAHVCQVEIGAITYKNSHDTWQIISRQQEIDVMGEYGTVDDVKKTDTIDLSQNKTLFLMRTSYMTQGEGAVDNNLFLFWENKWRSIGSITVAEDNTASLACANLSCISYTGKLSVILSKKEYPDLLLTTKINLDIDSDIPNVKEKIAKPSNRIYVFNGKEYEEKKVTKTSSVKSEKIAIIPLFPDDKSVAKPSTASIGRSANAPQPSQPNIPLIDNLEETEAKCEELGFKPQSPKFGKCVLELSK